MLWNSHKLVKIWEKSEDRPARLPTLYTAPGYAMHNPYHTPEQPWSGAPWSHMTSHWGQARFEWDSNQQVSRTQYSSQCLDGGLESKNWLSPDSIGLWSWPFEGMWKKSMEVLGLLLSGRWSVVHVLVMIQFPLIHLNFPIKLKNTSYHIHGLHTHYLI